LVGKGVEVDMEFAICKAQEERLLAKQNVVHLVRLSAGNIEENGAKMLKRTLHS
jgi:hypothetical protein